MNGRSLLGWAVVTAAGLTGVVVGDPFGDPGPLVAVGAVLLVVGCAGVGATTAAGRVQVRLRRAERVAVATVTAAALLVAGLEATEDEPPDTPAGWVVVDGVALEPPYRVEVEGLELRINDALVRHRAVQPPGQAPLAPADPDEAEELGALALARIADAGGPWSGAVPQAAMDAVIAELTAHPRVASVEWLAPLLHIEDDAGGLATVEVQAPRLATEDELAAGLEDEASVWRDLLDSGGGLMIADGASVEVPAARAEQLLADLEEAIARPAHERAEALRAAVRLDTVAESLADGIAIASVLDRPLGPGSPMAGSAAPADPSPEPGTVPLGPVQLASRGTHHVDGRTPEASGAYVFTPFASEGVCHVGPMKRAALLHGYTVFGFEGAASNEVEFLNSSGRAGLLHLCMHGGYIMQTYDTEDEARAAARRVGDALRISDVPVSSYTSNRFVKHYVPIWRGIMQAHWQPAGTVLWSDGCSGAAEHTRNFFRAREYIGISGLCYPTTNLPLHEAFWGRMAGTLAGGSSRAVVDAFDGMHLPAGSPWQRLVRERRCCRPQY